MTNTMLYTVTQIADALGELPQRVKYIIQKHRLQPVQRVGIIRLFSEQQVQAIRQGLYGIRIRGQQA